MHSYVQPRPPEVGLAARRDLASLGKRVRRLVSSSLFAATLALAGPAAAQEGEPSWFQRALSATNESSPVGLVPKDERQAGWQGWFSDAWQGSKQIFRDGHSDLLLPLYTFHPPYKYPNRHQQNEYPWGVGVARTTIDSNDNERIVYLLAFSDSHYDFQPMAGYGWIARWPLFWGLKGGLGYTVGVTARADANYIPFPVILPLASIGNDYVTFYGSWIPTTDVLFFFARFSLPTGAGWPASGPRAAGSGNAAAGEWGDETRVRANLIYVAGAWVNTDASGIDTVASSNSWAPLAGYRHFFTDRWAADLSVARSSHSLDLGGARLGNFDLIPVILTAQYHLPVYDRWRMHAGLGVAYSRITNQDMPGYTLASNSISPVLQAGASFSAGGGLVVTGGLSANFTRNALSQGDTNLGTVKLSPVTFTLGVGWAF